MRPIDVQTPTWTQSAYGEPKATYGTARKVLMFLGWINAMKNDVEGSIYREYDFVGLTREDVKVGELVDSKLIVGHVDKSGRFNRLFMNYAEGVERTYGG